jgi:hypothetical protein
MPEFLQSDQQHDHEQAAYMQAWRCRIESDVATYWPAEQKIANLIRVLVEKAPPFQVIEQRMRSHGTKIDKKGVIFYGIPNH